MLSFLFSSETLPRLQVPKFTYSVPFALFPFRQSRMCHRGRVQSRDLQGNLEAEQVGRAFEATKAS